MDKRTTITAALSLVLSTSATQLMASTPNIIYILVDDLGVGDLGCYGGDKINTPSIDRMASEGMLFTNHYCGSSVSAPSRVTLLTGKHTGHAAIRALPTFAVGGPVDIGAEDTLVSEELKRAGYTTAVIGKWGLTEVEGNEVSLPNNKGFDYFYGFRSHTEAHTYYPEYLLYK